MTSCNNVFLCFLLCFLAGEVAGQTQVVDSLKSQLAAATEEIKQAPLLNQLAYYTYRQDVEQAAIYAHQAAKLSKKHHWEVPLVDAYINLGRCFRSTQDFDTARFYLEKALSISDLNGYTKGQIDANNNLGVIDLQRGQDKSARKYFAASLALAKAINDPKGTANGYSNLAIIAENENDLNGALLLLDSALHSYLQVEDIAGISRTYSNQAYILDVLEKNEAAVQLYFKALEIQISQGLLYQQAFTLSQIGDLFFETDQIEEALNYYNRSLTISEEIDDQEGIFIALENIGTAYLEQGDRPSALRYFNKGLTYAEQQEDQDILGATLTNLGIYYQEDLDSLEQAERFFLRAEPLLLAEESPEICVLYVGLGEIEEQRGNQSKAVELYEKALHFSEDFGYLTNQELASHRLSNLHRQLGQTELALAYTDRYHTIKDSLKNEEFLEKLNELSIAYESEKKEKENAQLIAVLVQEQEEKRKQRIWYISILFLSLMLGIAAWAWNRYRQQLRSKVHELTLQKERAQQELSRKEAEKLRELDTMKTRFFTNVSHEFRTPLTLILGQNEQLKTAITDQSLQQRMEMVERSGQRLLDLVNQVLDLAKLESEGMDLQYATLDAIPFLRQILEAFEGSAIEKEIQLEFDTESKKLITAFDPEKMERVFFNLLSNAIKFTPRGGHIKMIVEEYEQSLRVGIQDTGPGIQPDQLPYIFNRFFQVDGSNQPHQPGTGIGLSLVKELVEKHAGSINVDSQWGKGSTFWVVVPLPESLDPAWNQEPSQVSMTPLPINGVTADSLVQEEERASQDVSQLLVVEDNLDVLAYVSDLLRGMGYQVLTANNGKEGLAQARKHLPDLIISDIMMPKMDGFEFAKAIRSDQRCSHIPLVLLTSKASDESKITGYGLGIDDYLLKPFHAKQLKVRIASLIEQRRFLRQKFSEALTIKPEEVSAIPLDQQFLKKVTDFIEVHFDNDRLSVEMLSNEVGMSVTHLNRKLTALIGQPAGKLIRSMRLQRAADLLQKQASSISEIAYDLGFSSPTNFTRSFKKRFGVSPSEYQKNTEE